MSGSRPFSFRHLPSAQQITLAILVLSALWTLFLLLYGGIDFVVLGIRVRSHDWSDSAVVAAVSLLVFAWLRRRSRTPVRSDRAIAAAVGRWWRTPDNLLLVAMLLIAAILRFWGLTFGLPHPEARPDEEAVSALAGSYYLGDFRQTEFTYPPLFILAVAATLWFSFHTVSASLSRLNVRLGLSDPTMSARLMAARFLSAVAGVISVWLLLRIGTRLFGRPAGFVAAACLALAFLHVRDSHFGTTDVPMTLMVLVGFLAIVRLSESGSRRHLLSAAILTGLAVATKYNAALLVLPAWFAILNDPLRRPIANRLARIVAFAAIIMLTFLILSPFSVLSHEKFLYDVTNVSRHLADGHGPDLGRGWTYHLTTTLRYGLGVPLLAAGILGLPLMVWREGRRGVLVALFPIAYYALIGSGRTVFARYILPVVPFLCLAAGYFVATMAAVVTDYLHRPRWRIPAITVMTAAVLLPSLLSVIAFDRLIAREDSRVLARRWIEERFEPGTTISQLGLFGAHAGYVYVDYETDYRLTDITASPRPTLIIVISAPFGLPRHDANPPWLEDEYDLRFVQQVFEDSPGNVYDRQDEFYVPLSGFHQITRPGPNLRIYVRR